MAFPWFKTMSKNVGKKAQSKKKSGSYRLEAVQHLEERIVPTFYYPSGVQNNVPISTVLNGGWQLIYQGDYATDLTTQLSSIQANTSQAQYVMLAAGQTGSSTLMLLGAAPKADVFFDEGTSNNTHSANGVGWYYSATYSWGFAPAGDAVSRNSADIATSPDNDQRLSWHTGQGVGGYRVGSVLALNSSTAYQRYIFAVTGPQISSLSPHSAVTGGASFTLTVTGTNFDSSSVVQWNGTNLATTFANGQLTAAVPAGNLNVPYGSASITVVNPANDPFPGTSTPAAFYINTPTATAPTLTSPTSASISTNSATLGGTVTADNGSLVQKRGILYAPTATNANPTLGGTGVIEVDDASAATGSFTDNVTGLTPGTSYSFVAFAVNDIGAATTSPVAVFNTAAVNVYGWGLDTSGQLGNNSTTNQTTPAAMQISGVIGVSSSNLNTLLLNADGTVSVTGSNASGQFGNGTTGGAVRTVPALVPNLSGVIAVATGSSDCFALKSDGTVWAWGVGSSGQLGNGANLSSSVPVQVSGLTGVTAISAGSTFALALKSDGTVRAWGLGTSGQLGNGASLSSNVPVQVSGLTGMTAVAAGGNHSLALKSDGTVRAWGVGTSGQLGNGVNASSNVPVQVSGLTGITAIAAGANHGLALKSDGTVRAWGVGSSGQLGNGATATSNVPVQVSGLTGVAAIASGSVSNSSFAVEANTNTNHPPTVASDNASVSANEGSNVTNTGAFSDADGNSTVTLTATVAGVPFGTVTPNNAAGTWSWSAPALDGPAGPTTVTITATDDKNAQATTTFTYTVNNVPPTINTFTVPTAANEGDTVNLAAAASDPAGALDPLTYSWTITGPGIAGSLSLSGTNPSFKVLDNGSYGVSLTVSDGDGGSATQSASISVSNVNPNFVLGGNETLPLNVGTFSRTGLGFTDPGADTWSATVDYGDGSGVQTLPVNADKSFALAHNYLTPATDTVTVVITDKDGGAHMDSFTVTVQSPTTVYVDDDWATKSPGDAIANPDPVATGEPAAVYGFNAFAMPNAAIAAVASGGTVVNNAGSYGSQAVLINKPLTYTLQQGPIAFGSLGDSVSTAAINLGVDLTTGGNNGDSILSSPISGAGSLTKTGAGVMTLAGSAANSYTGATNVTGGVLALTKSANTNAIPGGATATNGQIRVDGMQQLPVDAAITLNAGGVFRVSSAGSETLTNYPSMTAATSEVQIAGPLTIVNNATEAAGLTTLAGGTLTLGSTGTMNFALTGGTLQGSGTIVGYQVQNSATIDPGIGATSAGTITIQGALILNPTSVLNLNTAAAGSDLINVQYNSNVAGPPATSPTALTGVVQFGGTLNTGRIVGSTPTNLENNTVMNFEWRQIDPLSAQTPPQSQYLRLPSDFATKNLGLDGTFRYDPRFVGPAGQLNATSARVDSLGTLLQPYTDQAKSLKLTALTNAANNSYASAGTIGAGSLTVQQTSNNFSTGHSLVKVTITNSGAALAGPVYLEVTPPSGMQVFNKAGFTQGYATRPSSTKQPYLLVSTGGLATGATATVTVDIASLMATKPVLGMKVLYGGLP